MDKRVSISRGWYLPASMYYGDSMKSTRIDMKSSGAVYDSKGNRWVFPSRSCMDRYDVRPKPTKAAPSGPSKPVVALPAVRAMKTPLPATSKPSGGLAVPSGPGVGKVEPQPVKRSKGSMGKTELSEPYVTSKPSKPRPKSLDGYSMQVNKGGYAKRLMSLPAAYVVNMSVATPGAVSYETLKIEYTEAEANGRVDQDTRKETIKTVYNKREREEAVKKSDIIRRTIRKLGVNPQTNVIRVRKERADELWDAMSECRQIAIDHNSQATHHRISVGILVSETLSEDAADARQYAELIQEGMDELRQAIDDCNVAKIRSAATAFKALAGGVKDSDSQMMLNAVAEARQIARYVDNEVTRKRRQISEVKRKLDTSAIDTIRLKFLEYEASPELEAFRVSTDRYASLGGDEVSAPENPKPGTAPGRYDL